MPGQAALQPALLARLANFARLTLEALSAGHRVYFFGNGGSAAVGITTSGASTNVLRGLRAARRRGAHTVALTGAATGKIKRLADILLDVPSRDTQRIQEAHITLGHIYCELIERRLFARR